MKNILDQLGDEPPPEMPSQLGQNLHQRINNLLVGQQILEVAFLAAPFVFFHYLRALTGAACFSLTGRYPPTQDSRSGDDHASGHSHGN